MILCRLNLFRIYFSFLLHFYYFFHILQFYDKRNLLCSHPLYFLNQVHKSESNLNRDGTKTAINVKTQSNYGKEIITVLCSFCLLTLTDIVENYVY